MAEEFVRMEHFEEFSRRVDERILGVEKRMEQGFAHAEKAREQNLVHINQRFADAEKARDQNLVHVNQRFDSLEKRFDDLRTLIVVMYTPIAIAILAAVVKWFFFSN